ncbi:MAG TPA: hypothetical protein VF064_06735 [Pyrinomonadaceae bacterium]
MSAPTQKDEAALGPRVAGGNGARPDRPTLEHDDVVRHPAGKDSLESKRRTRNGVRRRFITY